MTKRKNLLTIGIFLIVLLCACGLALSLLSGISADAAQEPNSTDFCNGDLSGSPTEYEAVTIDYNGVVTDRYGIQAYAGLSGQAWFVGNTAAFCKYGSSSHVVGSNSGDRRSALTVTISVNAERAGEAYLFLYVEAPQGETVSIRVNDGDEQSVILTERWGMDYQNGNVYPKRPCPVAVTLDQGVNTILVRTNDNYSCWFSAFAISPKITPALYADGSTTQTSEYAAASWYEKNGQIAVSNDSIGLNAFDNSADYGKTGSVTYEICAAQTGTYQLGLYVMAGSNLANRAKLTVNGSVVTENGNEYVSFSTAAGWSGLTWNYCDIQLNQGVNTLKIENSLTRVNAEKTQEVLEGGVLVSNWWMDALSLMRKGVYSLAVEIDGAQTVYNPGREFVAEGLVVKLMDGDTPVETLAQDRYRVSVSENTVTVIYTGSYEGVSPASFSLSRTNEGLPFAGKTVEFDGTETEQLAWYNYAAVKGEGTGACEGRLYWVIDSQPVAGGYTFGSAGNGEYERRQMTLTIKVNNTGDAGLYLLKSYVNANNNAFNTAQIRVNDSQYDDVNINGPSQQNETVTYPFIYAVQLNAGENTIELKLCDNYSAWFKYFVIAPVVYEKKTEFGVEDASRGGMGWWDTATGTLIANDYDRSLTFYLNVQTAGKYEIGLNLGTQIGKTVNVAVDNGETVPITTTGSGKAGIAYDFAAGDHTVTVSFGAADGGVDFTGLTFGAVKEITAIRLDTSEVTLEMELGSSLNLAKLKVYATHAGETEEELLVSGYTIDTSTFDGSKAGTYTVRVYATYFPDVVETFTVTVKSAREVVSVRIDASAIAELKNGGSLDLSKLIVWIVYSDGSEIRAMSNEYIVDQPSEFSNTKAGTYTFSVRYVSDETINGSFTVKVTEASSDTETPVEKKGCCSSITTTSVLIGALIVAAAIAPIAVCKKRNNK